MTNVGSMNLSRGYETYAAKMRAYALEGKDLEADVRFVDMLLSSRPAHVLDIGCGIGNAVNGLRKRGHVAFGIDPTDDVLKVARELYDPAWFREMTAEDALNDALVQNDLPAYYDAVLLSGNVASFLEPSELRLIFARTEKILMPGGKLVIGTTTAARGGPTDQDRAASGSALSLIHRFSDWHLGKFELDSPWSVSVYSVAGSKASADSSGIFILKN